MVGLDWTYVYMCNVDIHVVQFVVFALDLHALESDVPLNDIQYHLFFNYYFYVVPLKSQLKFTWRQNPTPVLLEESFNELCVPKCFHSY